MEPKLENRNERLANAITHARGLVLSVAGAMEMLVYSRPGAIELLPALPASLEKGAIQGMLARTFVKVDELAWDIPARSADVSLTSLIKQDNT